MLPREHHNQVENRRREVLAALDAVVTGHGGDYLFVNGRSVYGKTAMLANWIILRRDAGATPCYSFVSRIDSTEYEEFTLGCEQLLLVGGQPRPSLDLVPRLNPVSKHSNVAREEVKVRGPGGEANARRLFTGHPASNEGHADRPVCQDAPLGHVPSGHCCEFTPRVTLAWATSAQWAMHTPSSKPVTFPVAERQGK